MSREQSPDDARAAFRVAAALALIPALNMARTGAFGRGGTLALSLSGMFAIAAALLWTEAPDRVRRPAENAVAHLLRWSTIVAVVGHVCIAAGGGVIVLLAVPAYWLSLPIVAGSVVVLAGVRMWARLTGSADL